MASTMSGGGVRCLSLVLGLLLSLSLLTNAGAASSLPSRRSVPRDPLTWSYGRQSSSASLASSALPSLPVLSPSSIAADSPYNWTTLYYTQQLVDHFGWAEKAVFTQKYLVNADHWRSPSSADGPGPIFFYCGNEGYIETFAGNSGFMFDIAEEYQALLLFVEHRYYGSSFPFGSAEAAYANDSSIQYLTSEQAIVDYVQFLDWFKTDSTTLCQGQCAGVKVIGFGGSYGGMLAAWMRIKYPWALDGSIAASAPIWQFYGQVSPTVYNHIVTRDYTLDTPHCAKGIGKVWSIIDAFAASKQGLQLLTDVFRPCNVSVFTPQTVGAVYGFLSEAFGYMAMADYPYEASFLGPMPAYPVSYGCVKYFTDVDPDTASNETILQAVYGVANTFWNYTGEAGQCNDLNAQGPSTLGSQDGWDYQCCTEMIQSIGQYGGDIDMFWPSPFDLQEYVRGCERPMSRGGWGTTPRVGWIDEEYGGLHMEAASRIFFSSGGLDPWSGLTPNATAFDGLYSPSNPRGVVCYYMNHTAHHLDLRGRNDTHDPAEVVRVRNIERTYITAWMQGKDRPSDEELARAEAAVTVRRAGAAVMD